MGGGGGSSRPVKYSPGGRACNGHVKGVQWNRGTLVLLVKELKQMINNNPKFEADRL